jgi:hypothetical protein
MSMPDREIKSIVNNLRAFVAEGGHESETAMQEAAEALLFLMEQRRCAKEQFDAISASCHEILHGEL